MQWSLHWPHWFRNPPPAPGEILPDPVGDRLRSVVAEHARAKETCALSHQARIQGMIDELFLKMEEGYVRQDP